MSNMSPSRHGPSLPYSLVAGVTPCRGGWLVASAKVQGTIFAPEDPRRITDFIEVVDERPSYAVIALNAPVGYLNAARTGGRSCDREARVLLGRRGAAVKSAPVRIDSTRDIDLLPDYIDAISQTLLRRYREVATEMAPFRQRTIYETNPELSFYQLNDESPMKWSKHAELGVHERKTLLEAKIAGVSRILEAEVPGSDLSHLIDAAAILWSARRIHARAAVRIPRDPEWDEHGLRMELVR
jgi:predicted RNase H-like nuclease